MKKVLSVVAVALMLIGLVGCMDDPDGSKQHVSKNN